MAKNYPFKQTWAYMYDHKDPAEDGCRVKNHFISRNRLERGRFEYRYKEEHLPYDMRGQVCSKERTSCLVQDPV